MGLPSISGCCCLLFAVMVILIRIYTFYFGSPRHINYNTFTTLRRFTYLYGIMAMHVAHSGAVVERELFLATFVFRMIFCNSVSSQFSWIGNYHASEISADAAVPRLCCFP